MRYYKQFDDSGKLIAIGTGPGNTEITEVEYNALLSEIQEKAAYTEKLYAGEITADDVPEAWREEVQANVELLKAAEEEAARQEAAEQEELADMQAALEILGVSVDGQVDRCGEGHSGGDGRAGEKGHGPGDHPD